MKGALAGVRVIDLTAVIAGPLGMRILGDYGAEVIKVESFAGDIMRASVPTRHAQMGSMHLQLNRNKRSIALDLKTPQALEVMHRMIAKADVFAHNMRPDALKRLGLDYEKCRAHNPSLIHVGIIGFGRGGRNRDKPAYDDLIQAASGLAWLGSVNSGTPPRYTPVNLADRLTGVTTVHAVLAALFHRARTGEGQAVEIPMYETLIEFLMGDHLMGHTYQPPEAPMGNARVLSANRRPYKTRDGVICVLPYVDKHWQSFFTIAGLDAQYGSDPRFASPAARAKNIEEAYGLVATALEQKTTAEWLDLLGKADIPCSAVPSLDELLEEPHLKDVDFFKAVDHPTEGALTIPKPPVWMSETPPEMRAQASLLGEHTRDVLRELGYGEAEIAAMIAAKAAQQSG